MNPDYKSINLTAETSIDAPVEQPAHTRGDGEGPRASQTWHWRNKYGIKKKIADLDDPHLINILAMIARIPNDEWLKNVAAIVLACADYGCDCIDDAVESMSYFDRLKTVHPNLSVLVAEARWRKLPVPATLEDPREEDAP